MEFDFGMIGLGTMGRNLLLNLADHGTSVAGYNPSAAKVELLKKEGAGKPVEGFLDMKAFVASLRKPRAIMLLVPAGAAVDDVLAHLDGLIEPGDLIIDGGNSYFKDTERRFKALQAKNIGFFGMGVSGGEEGARHGPSMMAGGPSDFYERVQPILEAAAAKAADGEPCVRLLGSGAAGHYVKMVHNGIEYGMMQIISEAYDLMHRALGLSNNEIAAEFDTWSKGDFGGFLLEITATVLREMDGDKHLVDLVQDAAKQKGTGKWTSQEAMDLHTPIPTIDAAVAARDLSGLKDERIRASQVFPPFTKSVDKRVLAHLGNSLYATFLATYAQGLEMLRVASAEYNYGLNIAEVASVWRAGCIIRSALLAEITRVYTNDPGLTNLLADPAVAKNIREKLGDVRAVLAAAAEAGIPAPSTAASLNYILAYASPRLPANLIQAQRDFFGAHTYERIDKPGTFHTKWGQK
jgi:6-phosphogluconate dehydrogenase